MRLCPPKSPAQRPRSPGSRRLSVLLGEGEEYQVSNAFQRLNTPAQHVERLLLTLLNHPAELVTSNNRACEPN
jgi:hypothetical protein